MNRKMRFRKTFEGQKSGGLISGPATPCVEALWTDEHTELQKKANDMFALLNDGTRPEMEIWDEVYSKMGQDEAYNAESEKEREVELKVVGRASQTRERGTRFGKDQDIEKRYVRADYL